MPRKPLQLSDLYHRSTLDRELRALGLPESAVHAEQLAYTKLCKRAEALGIPTSLDDPDTPESTDDLIAAVLVAERATRQAATVTS